MVETSDFDNAHESEFKQKYECLDSYSKNIKILTEGRAKIVQTLKQIL